MADNVVQFPTPDDSAPQDEPLPTRAELADLVAHGLMSARDRVWLPGDRSDTTRCGQNGAQWAVGLIWAVVAFVVVFALIG